MTRGTAGEKGLARLKEAWYNTIRMSVGKDSLQSVGERG